MIYIYFKGDISKYKYNRGSPLLIAAEQLHWRRMQCEEFQISYFHILNKRRHFEIEDY